jgi:hypothetical protein
MDKDNVEGLYIVIIWIIFHVFGLNVVTIYLIPKDVKVSCDDKVVKLSYILDHYTISTIYINHWMCSCINVQRCIIKCWCVQVCFIEMQYVSCFEIVIQKTIIFM